MVVGRLITLVSQAIISRLCVVGQWCLWFAKRVIRGGSVGFSVEVRVIRRGEFVFNAIKRIVINCLLVKRLQSRHRAFLGTCFRMICCGLRGLFLFFALCPYALCCRRDSWGGGRGCDEIMGLAVARSHR